MPMLVAEELQLGASHETLHLGAVAEPGERVVAERDHDRAVVGVQVGLALAHHQLAALRV